MSETKPRYADLLSALFFIGLSIYIATAALPWGVYGIDGPGPGFFPMIYAALMFVLGIVMFWRGLRRPLADLPTEPSTIIPHQALEIDPSPKSAESTMAAMLTWVALALSIPLMMALGFLVGFFLLVLFVVRGIFKRSWVKSAIAAAAISAGLYILFHVLLSVDLPESMVWLHFFGGE